MLAPPRVPSPLSGPAIADALARARQGQPALVVGATLAEAPASLPALTRAVVWRTPDGAQWLGFGVAASFAAEHAAEAAGIPAACQSLLASGVFGPDEARLVLRGFGGLAFDPSDARPAPLSAPAPISAFWIPEALWFQAPGKPSLRVVAVPVEAGDDETSVRRRWNAAWSRAEAACVATSDSPSRFAVTPPVDAAAISNLPSVCVPPVARQEQTSPLPGGGEDGQPSGLTRCGGHFRVPPGAPAPDSACGSVVLSPAREREGGFPLGAGTGLADETTPDRALWHNAVTAALALIQAGVLGKVVLARAIALETASPSAPLALWTVLADQAPDTHRFLFTFPEGAALIGASPERLFALDGRDLSLDGLAGTAPRDVNAERDNALGAALLANDKDRREHAFVVRAIAEVLAPLVDHLSYPETPTLKRLPTVQHLHTPLTGTLRAGLGLDTLLTALHPTPAVGGTPRQAAIEAIRRLEPTSRGWYAGPVGWVSADAAEFAVAIRSAYLVGTQAAVMTGAGIVTGSTPEGEWDETARKAAPLLRLLTEDRA